YEQAPGLNLLTAMGPDKSLTLKVVDMTGTTVHEWAVDWFDIWPDANHVPATSMPQSRPGTHIHGTLLLPNGDVIFNFEKLGTVRMGVCGEVQWKLPYQTHHSIYLDENQILWLSGLVMHDQPLADYPMHTPPIREPTVVKVSLDGELLDSYSVFDLLVENDQRALLHLRSATLSNKVKGDSLHLNDVETFPTHMEEGVFRHGDVMLSLRNINTLLVFDPVTKAIRYMKVGGFVRQHDPDFIDGNTIMLFDNNNIGPADFGQQSRILLLNARSDEITVLYEGDEKFPFYTPIMGKQHILNNGHMIITDSVNGRGFETNASGEVIWEYINIVDDGVVGIVEELERIPASYRQVFSEAACQ
ncbi:MAG: arylsulfotransferase family protein, partial [Gammaproteobacteria bacterium]